MRISYVKFVNFYGIYIGTGKTELEFEIPDTGNKIILLRGTNGSGKTSLLSTMHILLETFDKRKNVVIPGKTGLKIVRCHDKGNDYECEIHYQKGKNKAFVRKNGIEQNENGNITSYLEFMESEFELTSDYFKIGRIGDNVSTFIDLTTTERKKFISKISNEMNDYLNSFAVVAKKTTALNKTMDGLIQKISKIPQESQLRSALELYQNNINGASVSLRDYNKKIGAVENELDVVKKKLTSYGDYLSIESEYEKLQRDRKVNETNLHTQLSMFPTLSDFSLKDAADKIETIKGRIELDNIELASLDEKLKSSIENANRATSEIKKLETEITTLKASANSLKGLKEERETLKANKDQYKDLFDQDKKFYYHLIKKKIDIDEFVVLLKKTNTMNTILNNIRTAFSDMASSVQFYDTLKISYTISFKKYTESIASMLDEHIGKFKRLTELVNANEKQLDLLISKRPMLDILSKRPAKCNIDDCAFIKEALRWKNVEKEILEVESVLAKNKPLLKNAEEKYNLLNNDNKAIGNFLARFKSSMDSIDLDLMKKLFDYDNKAADILSDIFEAYETRDSLFETFNFNTRHEIISNMSYFNRDNAKLKILESYIQELEQKDSNKLNDLNNDLQTKLTEKDKIKSDSKDLSEAKISKSGKVKSNILRLDIYSEYIKYVEDLNEINRKIEEQKSLIINITNDKLKLKELDKEVILLNSMVTNTNSKLKEFNDELMKINTMLSNLSDYNKEYTDIKKKFDVYNIIKKSLDIKTGIPLVFTGGYFKKIAKNVNVLLDIAFAGRFKIDFLINDKEFSIPVTIDGDKPSDDILEKSQGEIALTKLSLSLAMMAQAIKTYNVVYLDEVDAALSPDNRKVFFELLEVQIEMLGIEQVFVISHNENFDSSNCDMIMMRGASPANSDLQNIILDLTQK